MKLQAIGEPALLYCQICARTLAVLALSVLLSCATPRQSQNTEPEPEPVSPAERFEECQDLCTEFWGVCLEVGQEGAFCTDQADKCAQKCVEDAKSTR